MCVSAIQILLCTTVLTAQDAGRSHVDSEQLARTLNGLMRKLHNFEFVYEGKRERIGPESVSSQERAAQASSYQGLYIYRDKSSIYIEIYTKQILNPSVLLDSRISLNHGKSESVQLVPDLRSPRPSIKAGSGNPLALTAHPRSPQRVFYCWLLQDNDSFQSLNYQHLGWELVDGRHCLKFRLDMAPGTARETKPYRIFWVDLERGGHPLKVEESIRPPKVVARTHSVRLSKFATLDGDEAWLPVSGKVDYFLNGDVYSDTPIIRESYDLVGGSFKFLRAVTDEMLSIGRKSRSELSGILLKREFDDLASHPSPPIRTDRESVEKRLNQQLADADKQSKMLEASAPAYGVYVWNGLIPMVLLSAGVLIVVGALLYRRMAK